MEDNGGGKKGSIFPTANGGIAGKDSNIRKVYWGPGQNKSTTRQ